jgi:hypothetical protein
MRFVNSCAVSVRKCVKLFVSATMFGADCCKMIHFLEKIP